MTDTTFRRPIDWHCSAETHVGVVRELNEDAVFSKPANGLWAVADGMGGHALGDVASETVVKALDGVANCEQLSELVDRVDDALLGANQGMLDYARANFSNATMGSTVAALLIRGAACACIWAGDSRLYRFRSNALQQLTRDHSQVEEMVQMGLLSPEEASGHPQGNVITRAVGVEQALFLETTVFTAQTGDIYLLCSDGLYGAVTDDEMSAVLALRDPQQSADKLIEIAVANGARDNVSAIVVHGRPGKLVR